MTDPITYTGMIPDLPAAAYHTAPGYGSTLVRAACRSYRHMMIQAQMVATLAMMVGSAVHTLVLEPERADTVIDSGYAGDTGKGHRAMMAEHPDCIVLPSKAYRQAHDLAGAVHEFNDRRVVAGYGDLLDGAVVESSWCAELYGVLVRGRFDLWRPQMILDLKTTRDDVTDHDLERWLYQSGTHIQAALYSDLAAAVTGDDPPQFGVIVATKQPHHAVALRTIDPDAIELGRRIYRRGLRNITDALAGGHDLGESYPADFTQLTLPRWGWETA